MRDRDEWRRPWPDGAPGAPGVPSSVTASAAPDGAGSIGPAGASDVVADTGASVYDARGLTSRTDVPLTSWSAVGDPGPDARPSAGAVSAAPSQPASVRTGRAQRGGFLAGLGGGIVGATLAVLALVSVGILDGDLPEASPPAPTVTPGQSPDGQPLPDPGLGAAVIPDVADRVLPSVVRINTSGNADLTGAGALGSGVIYRSDGYIITNYHVIEGAAAVEVLLSDGDRYTAEIVGSDELNDLALLRIERDDLPAIALRPADEPVRVGETVIAMGSPFGLDATVTSGIISALNRDLRIPGSSNVIPAVIQTDAAINPGNSGGALVDLRGRLIGINTAIVSRSGSNEGVGFAVAVRQAIVSSDQLIEQGFVRYPLLGISGSDINAQVAEAFGLPNRRGAVVESVEQGSGADRGGLRVGDVIVAVDGLPLRSMSDLVAEVRRRAPGMTVTFEVLRGDERLTIEAVLGERPRS